MNTETPAGRAFPLFLFALFFGAFYLSYDRSYHLPLYPGYFLLQSVALALCFHYLWTSQRGRFLFPPPAFAWFAAFSIWAFATSAWAARSWICASGLQREATFVLSTLGFAWLFRQESRLRRHLWTAVLLVLIPVTAIYAVRCWSLGMSGRFGYPFGNPNLAAAAIGFGCMFAAIRGASLWSHERKMAAAWLAASVLFAVPLAFACRSKGAILALAVVFGAASIWRLRDRSAWRRAALAISAAGLFGATAWAIAHWDAIAASPSAEIRIFLWQDTWRMICHSLARFLSGWGPGNFFANFPDFQDPRMFTASYQAPVALFPHNICLEMWAEYGLVGLSLWICMFAAIGISALRSIRRNPECRGDLLGAAAGLAFLLLYNQVTVALSYPAIQFLAMLCAAWTLSLEPWRPAEVSKRARRWAAIALLAAIPAGLLLWKTCAWDSLQFHFAYRSARSSHVFAGGKFQPVEIAQSRKTAAALISVDPPLCEDSYTCQWRNDVGRIAIDCFPEESELAMRALPSFSLLESRMPLFGDFLLNQAVLAAKRGFRRQADENFSRFARRNPFSPDLWIWWALACRNRNATSACMLDAVSIAGETYGEDGAFWLGEALVRDLAGEKRTAHELMLRAAEWQGRGAFDVRAAELRRRAGFYLQASGE